MLRLLLLITAVSGLGLWIELPQVFVVGDSISIQYGPYLKTYLGGIARYARKDDTPGQTATANLDFPAGANGGDSKMVLAYLTQRVKEPDFKPDLLLLNCGLHDIKRDPKTNQIQVDSVSYRKNLESVYRLLTQQRIPIVWVRTTPVVDSIHNRKGTAFFRFASDLTQYNRIADEVWQRHRVPQLDLHTFTRNQPGNPFIDHVHYNEPTRALQAAFIAGHVARHLKR